MAANVTFSPETFLQRDVPAHAVYTRELWGQNWVQKTWLFADSVTFSLPPAIGTAQLRWRFGEGMRQGEPSIGWVQRLSGLHRHWVRISFTLAPQADGTPRYLHWYGMLDVFGEEKSGLVRQVIPTGEQPITAYSLEHAFYKSPVRKSIWRNATSGAEKTIDRALVFNGPRADGSKSGNRSADRGMRSYLFADQIGVEDEPWSTRTIAEYLVETQSPKGVGGVERPRYRWDTTGDAILAPDWDEPAIDPTGKSLGEVLDEVFPRGRMLGWRLVVDYSDPDETNEPVLLKPVSHLGADLVTPIGTFKRNPFRLHLAIDAHADYQAALKDSTIQQVDQVRIRGARRTSTCTLSFADGTLEAGWPSDLEEEYEEAFSGDEDYDLLSTPEKQLRNAEVRAAEHLHTVFARFAIPADWDQTVFNGLGAGEAVPVFPVNPGAEDASEKYPVCPRELFVEKTLPALTGYNYEIITIPAMGSIPAKKLPPERVSTGPHVRLPPLVLFLVPDSDPDRYIHIEKLAHNGGIDTVDQNDERWMSCLVEVAHMDRAVLLRVFGRPQHAIAYTDFETESLAVDPFVGTWDWQDALFTVALSDDRWCEGVWPPDNLVPPAVVGSRRELLIHVPGDRYRQDYLVPGTVIGVDPAGDLVRCEAGGWINDDSGLLEARAKMAYEYYKQQRRSLVLATSNLDTDIEVGDYIESIGGVGAARTIGTVVTDITITVPDDSALQITYSTAFVELDPIAISTS